MYGKTCFAAVKLKIKMAAALINRFTVIKAQGPRAKVFYLPERTQHSKAIHSKCHNED